MGRNIENSEVDVDLSSFAERSKRVSHHHAHIFYDFEKQHFALEVLGRNGCMVQGVFYPPDSDAVKLNSQDLIEIVGIKIYFLLPTRSIIETFAAQRSATLRATHSSATPPNQLGQGKSKRKNKRSSGRGELNTISADPTRELGESDNSEHKKNSQGIVKEENDVVSSIANLISDVYEPGEWVPMMKLHSEKLNVPSTTLTCTRTCISMSFHCGLTLNYLQLLQRFGKIWSQDNISKYLITEEGSSTETKCRPWSKLLELLKKHPQYFITNTMTRGEATSESVVLAST
ncbi:hypothetical protein PR202_gb21339 [Eleusine coracana subsp. coracana]|uniref:FHA domain-containing protein n=1 Tax=Eleusine coracana subsp. coracana TaxID=191504 RepID=A0AAV5FD54_ELECO|nr:hypothetical protein PR202_gb21339 [Eleusine coracana subsp. coracana]